ncbi:MAG: DUF3459 domain-containing protein [Alphaproteobacteria bacterium]|nr:DUF3459 domain-containing protein [Alphaproteobacteria bacterium]
MEARGEGWFERETTARPGDLYHFRLALKGGKSAVIADPAGRGSPYGFEGREIEGRRERVSQIVDLTPAHPGPGRPAHELAYYQLHTGTFTDDGTFAAVEEELDSIRDLGFTAIVLNPTEPTPGKWNWGYDCTHGGGATKPQYGTPEDLQRLVAETQARGLVILDDVVYNHYAACGADMEIAAGKHFFHKEGSPWGPSPDLTSPLVRRFLADHALYKLKVMGFDGLRFDAPQSYRDDPDDPFLVELTRIVAADEDLAGRHIHFVLENGHNDVRLLRAMREAAGGASIHIAQWNDDFHHTAESALGERDGNIEAHKDDDDPLGPLVRTLKSNFIWDWSKGQYVPSDGFDLPPTISVTYLQNHDQIGNRALGDRLNEARTCLSQSPERLALMTAVMLLGPGAPMVFMGQEYGARTHFWFFTDWAGVNPGVAKSISDGRKNEFREVLPAHLLEQMPDPEKPEAFTDSKLDRREADSPEGREWRQFFRDLLAFRHAHVVPVLAGGMRPAAESVLHRSENGQAFEIVWPGEKDGEAVGMCANFGTEPALVNSRNIPPLSFESRAVSGGQVRVLKLLSEPGGNRAMPGVQVETGSGSERPVHTPSQPSPASG